MSGESDAELVERLRSGDRSAFGELYERHAGAVARAVADRVFDREERLDIVQESFTRALTKVHLLSDASRFRPWVLQIARNAAADQGRRKMSFDPDSLDATEMLPESPEPGPDAVTEVAMLAEQLAEGFARLSTRDATAVTLATEFGFGPTEIGAALGISPGNAKVVLHRARKRLRAAIEQQDLVDSDLAAV